jgi:hypothetical protein
MPAGAQSALFSHLLLEAAPGEVSGWRPLDMLELLTGTTTSRRIVDSLDPAFSVARTSGDSATVLISLPADTFAVGAAALGDGWFLTGTDRLLAAVLETLPEPWPQPQ